MGNPLEEPRWPQSTASGIPHGTNQQQFHNRPTEIYPYTDSLPTNSRRKPHRSHGHLWKCKFLLYILSLLACIANFGLVGFLKTRWSNRSIIMYSPSLAVVLLWDIACCINYAKHRSNDVGNPGLFAVADLVAFLAMLASTVCVGLFDIIVLDDYPWAWLGSQLQTSVRSTYACLGVGSFIGFIHLVLFIVACCECHRRRKKPRTRKIRQHSSSID